jgi:hypothetical protein
LVDGVISKAREGELAAIVASTHPRSNAFI